MLNLRCERNKGTSRCIYFYIRRDLERNLNLESEVRNLADTTEMVLSETQKLYEQRAELQDLQAYANMLNTPDIDGKIGEVTDLTAVMRIKYNAGSSTRIHTSDAFNKYFAEFVKSNASELVTRTVQKALEMIKEQQVKASAEVLEQLNIQSDAGVPPLPVEGAPVFTSPLQAVAYVGEDLTYYIGAASLPPSVITYAVENLPDGLTLDSKTGKISGAVAEAGSYTINMKATNDKGTSVKMLSLVVAEKSKPAAQGPTAPVLYGQVKVEAVEEKELLHQCSGLNIPDTGVTWSIDSGTLPDGLTLDASTGLISGTLAAGSAGTYEIILKVETPDGYDLGVITFEVLSKSAGSSDHAFLSAPSARTGKVGESFHQSFMVKMYDPSLQKFIMTGAPSSLSIDSTSGQITGTFTSSDTSGSPYTVKVAVVEIANTSNELASTSFTLTVANA